jgi:hypothetical protein
MTSSTPNAFKKPLRGKVMCGIIVTAEEHCSQEFTEPIIVQPLQSQNQSRPDLLRGLVPSGATYFHNFLGNGDPVADFGNSAAKLGDLAEVFRQTNESRRMRPEEIHLAHHSAIEIWAYRYGQSTQEIRDALG